MVGGVIQMFERIHQNLVQPRVEYHANTSGFYEDKNMSTGKQAIIK